MSVVLMGFLGSLIAGMMTMLGAIPVLLGKDFSKRSNDTLLGFAAGVMLAASFFSLIIPGIDFARSQLGGSFLPAFVAVAGVLLGVGFVALLNAVIPHEHFIVGPQGPSAENLARIWLFVLAITIHNIPEGLAVGVAFGALAADIPSASLAGAMALALGIGIQNFPEGAAVSVPLRREGLSRSRSFWYGQLSGMVEPLAGVAGAAAVVLMKPILPYALAFAAGAMIYVVAEELIPSARQEEHSDFATTGVMLGFAVMMTLDVALG